MYLCRCSLFLGIAVVKTANNNREQKRYKDIIQDLRSGQY